MVMMMMMMMMMRQPRGGGVAFRLTGAGCMARIWELSGFSDPKALAGVCENIADVAIAIAIPGASDLGSTLLLHLAASPRLM